MLRCLREKKHAAWCAVKVLDFALTDNDTNCQRWAKSASTMIITYDRILYDTRWYGIVIQGSPSGCG